MQMLDPITN